MANTAVKEVKPGLFSRIHTFYQEVMVEMGKVTWPSKEDLRLSTQTTMYLLGIMATIIFSYDLIFSKAAHLILNLFK